MGNGLRWTPEQLQAAQARTARIEADIRKAVTELLTAPIRPRKYRNEPCEVDGLHFDSKHEAEVWRQLRARELAGEIAGLRLQVPYACVVNGIHVCDWIADFDYREQGVLTVVDAKSEATRKLPVYRLKKKLMQACHNIEVREL